MRIIMVLALLLLISTIASAASQKCLTHPEMVAFLLKAHKEHPVRFGISEYDKTPDGKLIPALKETFESRSGTWTDVRTNLLSGEACITDYGINAKRKPIPPWPLRRQDTV